MLALKESSRCLVQSILKAGRAVAMALRAVVAAAFLVAAVAGCAAPSATTGKTAKVQKAHTFQRHLDKAGIAFRVPSKGKAILVNLPAFELIAFEDGKPVFRSPVIVGSVRHPTPRMTTHVSKVRFRPTWRPTPSMIRSGEYRGHTRPPGRRNPLGLAAVRLQPGLLIYLHDTNRRDLFDRKYRALSHGCIRVKKWDKLVGWVLGIPIKDVHARTKRGRNVDVRAPRIPVVLGYYTQFPKDDGTMQTYKDVYRLGRSGKRRRK